MTRKRTKVSDQAGEWTKIGDRVEIKTAPDSRLSEAALETLALIMLERQKVAVVEIPLAAVAALLHALCYLRNNPNLDGLIRAEVESAWGVLRYVADDMYPGAEAAFDELDVEMKRLADEGAERS